MCKLKWVENDLQFTIDQNSHAFVAYYVNTMWTNNNRKNAEQEAMLQKPPSHVVQNTGYRTNIKWYSRQQPIPVYVTRKRKEKTTTAKFLDFSLSTGKMVLGLDICARKSATAEEKPPYAAHRHIQIRHRETNKTKQKLEIKQNNNNWMEPKKATSTTTRQKNEKNNNKGTDRTTKYL